MMGLAAHFTPGEHTLITPPMLGWIRRNVPPERSEKMFMYFSHRYGNFVVGEWLNRAGGYFVDVLNLGHSLGNFTRAWAQEFLRDVHRPVGADDMARMIRQAHSDEQHSLNDSQGEYSQQFRRGVFNA
jgi:hypothetical protein